MDTPGPLRVFISSTYSDLKEYRKAVASTLLRFGLEVSELSTTDLQVVDQALWEIQASDIVIVLVAYRLGFVPEGTNKSLVELEYDRALEAGKPVLCFLLEETVPWPRNQIDLDYTGIEAFRRRLKNDRLVNFFTTPDDLAMRVAHAISRYSRQVEGISAVPSTPSPSTEPSAGDLADILDELKVMRAELSVLQQLVADVLRQSTGITAAATENSSNVWPDFLGPPASSVDQGRCFVIMPYSQKWSVAVERIILEVCTQAGLDFRIAKNMEGRFIPSDIWQGITSAGIVVADLSGANPNVTYEVGLADVMGKEVILITQEGRVPFDFLAQRFILYEDFLPGSLSLREELTDRLTRYKAKCS